MHDHVAKFVREREPETITRYFAIHDKDRWKAYRAKRQTIK